MKSVGIPAFPVRLPKMLRAALIGGSTGYPDQHNLSPSQQRRWALATVTEPVDKRAVSHRAGSSRLTICIWAISWPPDYDALPVEALHLEVQVAHFHVEIAIGAWTCAQNLSAFMMYHVQLDFRCFKVTTKLSPHLIIFNSEVCGNGRCRPSTYACLACLLLAQASAGSAGIQLRKAGPGPSVKSLQAWWKAWAACAAPICPPPSAP